MIDAVVLLIGAGVFVDLWLGAYTFLHLQRRYIGAACLILGIDAAIAAATFVGLDPGVGLLGPGWNAVGLWTFELSHPLLALVVLLSIHGAAALRRHAYVLALFAPLPVLAIVQPSAGITVGQAYQTSWLSSYLVVCLALGLAEAIAWWRATELHRAEAFGLILATTIAIITGPAYSFELQFLNIASGQGANPGLPLVLAVLAFVAVRANALHIATPTAATSGTGRFPAGRVAVLDEVRPKYASLLSERAGAAGQPVLLIGGRGLPDPWAVGVPPNQHGPARVASTIREFGSRYRGGLVTIRNLGDVAAAGGPNAAAELAAEAGGLARAGHIGLIVSLAALTDAERNAVTQNVAGAAKLPRPEQEIHAILARALGSAAARILAGYAATRGVRTEDLTPEDVPKLVDHLRTTLAELARVLDDEPVVLGWRKEADRIGLELDRFARLSLDELTEGPWPSSLPQRTQEDYLVRAADYWRGTDLEEALRVAELRTASLKLGERARALFLESLGPAGSHLFDMELKRLQRSARDLSAADIRAIAESTDRAAGDLSAAIDVASGRSEIEMRVRELRERLLDLAGGAR